jgi:tRNA (mo5U34)-methyltransferase
MPVHPKLAGRSCYHRYEIEPGLFTPGTFLEVEPKRCLDELGIPAGLSGLKVLEIGAWDGAFTFELARRGAAVTALDIQDPDVTVFNAVRNILNVAVTYVRTSVYDLQPETQEPFDIVVFAGVYYHLKNPVLALQRIREVLKDGGTLYIEGASCSHYLGKELARALPGTSVETLTELVDELPISVFDAEKKIYSHWSNWWFPTTRCLEVMLYDSGFKEVELALKTNAFYNHSHRRLMGRALADPGKLHPGEQQHEHEVYEQDYKSSRLAGGGLSGLLKRISRKLRSYIVLR